MAGPSPAVPGPGSGTGGWESGWDQQAISLLILSLLNEGYSGIFVYDPAPGHGNLIGSWSAAAGTDPYGNAYPQGLSVKVGAISGIVITGSTFEGTDFLIDQAGLFFYSGTPANGNLIASIAPAAGSDAHGNPYFAGLCSYGSTANGPNFSQLLAGIISTGLLSDNTPASVSGQQGALNLSSGGKTALASPVTASILAGTTGSLDGWMQLPNNSLGLFMARDVPALGNTGGWNPLSLAAGWANSGGGPAGQYRMVASPGNSFEIIGDLNPGTVADGTVIATITNSAYHPIDTQAFPLAFAGTAPSSGVARLSVNSSGQLQCAGLAGLPGTARVIFHALISLDA